MSHVDILKVKQPQSVTHFITKWLMDTEATNKLTCTWPAKHTKRSLAATQLSFGSIPIWYQSRQSIFFFLTFFSHSAFPILQHRPRPLPSPLFFIYHISGRLRPSKQAENPIRQQHSVAPGHTGSSSIRLECQKLLENCQVQSTVGWKSNSILLRTIAELKINPKCKTTTANLIVNRERML